MFYTTIEQSKILMEKGIPSKTADMYYWCGDQIRIGGYKAMDLDYDIPAWSLSALLDVIRSWGRPVSVGSKKKDEWYATSGTSVAIGEDAVSAIVELIHDSHR